MVMSDWQVRQRVVGGEFVAIRFFTESKGNHGVQYLRTAESGEIALFSSKEEALGATRLFECVAEGHA